MSTNSQHLENPIRPLRVQNSKDKEVRQLQPLQDDTREDEMPRETSRDVITSEDDDGDPDEEEEKDDESVEKPKIKVAADPVTPTRNEIREHRAAFHVPYRSWCRHCVRGKAKNEAHRKTQEDDENDIPRICMDYCFMGQDDEHEKMAILVIVDKRTKTKFSHYVSKKGVSHDWIIGRVIKDIESLGYGKIILKCDQEPALVDLQEAIKEQRK